MIDSVLLPPKD